MSWVANVMLSVALDDREQVEALNAWLDRYHREDPQVRGVGELRLISGKANTLWGGYKYPECTVFAGALNHANLPELVARIGETAWKRVGAVQLLIKDQEQNYFRLWMIRDGKIVQYAPPPTADGDAY